MRITEALAGPEPVFSFEFFPPKTPEGLEQLFEAVETLRPLEPDYVSVTYGAGGATRDGTVEIADRIKSEHEIEAMAHLSCVGETREGLAAILDRFAEAGVENVLALRGDPPRGESAFAASEGGLASAAELTEFIASGWDFTVGGACFPEVHPEAASLEDDLAYLKTKVDAGASFLITQLFFDNDVYWSFVAAARDRGIDVPIIPGVIPIASYAQVARICSLCDATIPHELDAAHAGDGWRPRGRGAPGRRLRVAPVRGAPRGRRARHPLLCAQPRARDARRPQRAPRLAAVGAASRTRRAARA